MLDERLLARAVALVHAADLRDGLVRLVDHDDEVAAEVVEQRVRRRARRAPVEDPRVVLDPVAVAELLEHLQVVLGPLPDPVGLEQLALRLEEPDLLLQLAPDLAHGALDRVARGHVLGRREDGEVVEAGVDLARERVEVRDLLDLVAEERDAVRRLHVRGLHLDDVAPHAEAPAPEDRVVARVLDVDELAEHDVAVDLEPDAEHHGLLLVLDRRADAVDARDRGDDEDVLAREERSRRRVAEAVDVVVDGRVLLDVEIRLRDVRLRLVVVVVGDEVLDRVLRQELAELVAELRGQRLVVRDHERGLLYLLGDPRHRGRLAGARRPEQASGTGRPRGSTRTALRSACGWSPVGV